jgi:hypothetical protein
VVRKIAALGAELEAGALDDRERLEQGEIPILKTEETGPVARFLFGSEGLIGDLYGGRNLSSAPWIVQAIGMKI